MRSNLQDMPPRVYYAGSRRSSPHHDRYGYRITSHNSQDEAEEPSHELETLESDNIAPSRIIHVPGGSPCSIYGVTSVSSPSGSSLDVRDISFLKNNYALRSDNAQPLLKPNVSYVETLNRGRNRSNSLDPTSRASLRGGMSESEASTLPEPIVHVPSDKNVDDRGDRSHPRLKDREAKLPRLRSRTSQTRARVIVSRGDLREARLDTSAADEGYMKIVRDILVRQRLGEGSTEKDELDLEAAYTQLQDARDIYGPLEESYIALEESLERQDYELSQLEDQISRYTVSHFKDDDNEWDSLSNSSDGRDSKSSQYVEKSDPLYSEYLSRLGDRDLLREAYADLVNEYTRLHDQLRLRQAIHADLHPEDQARLKSFPSTEEKIRDQLSSVDTDIERLRQACIKEGIVVEEDADDEYLYVEGFQSEDQNGNFQRIPNSSPHIEKVSPTQSEYLRFPRLLENPCDENEDLEISKSLLSDFELGNIGNRITRWLLHKLRSSCSEVELLARFSSNTDGLGLDLDIDEDTERWQEEVLDLWFVDSANLPRSAYVIEPTAVNIEITGMLTTASVDTDSPSQSPSIITLPELPLSQTASRTTSAQPSPPSSPLHFPPSPRYWKFKDTDESVAVGRSGAPAAAAGEVDNRGTTALNPQLTKYAVDNSTSQRVHIVVRTSTPSSLSWHHTSAIAHEWSSGALLDMKTLDVGTERCRGLKKRKDVSKGRRAMSVSCLSTICLH